MLFRRHHIIVGLLALFLSASAQAVPFLQLDIEGGTYVGGNEESVMTNDKIFTLYAHALRGTKKMSDADLLGEDFFIAAALTPKDGFDGTGLHDLGTFDVTFTDVMGNRVTETIDVTADMVFGVPPLEPTNNNLHDGGDLPKHDIYETWFKEIAFRFTGDNTSGEYNVQDDAGLGAIAGTDMYFETFEFDLTNLDSPYNLYFDLYSIRIKNETDYDVDYHAPFSKNAGTDIWVSVPLPNTLLVLVTGLFLLGVGQRRTPR